MNIKHCCLFLIALIIAGCSSEPPKNSKSKKPTTPSNHGSSATDTLVIDHKTALEVQLDSAALEQNRKKYGDTSVDAYTEDGAYYESIADSVIRQKKLPVMQSLHYKFIRFVQHNGAATTVKVDTLSMVSTLFFFDPAKLPHMVDVTDVENEYKSYFQ
jgi:hypothetical protein